jgi:biotin transport system substrate-specific component
MKIRPLVFTALFAALTALGAFLQIPVKPVAVTLQFLFTAMAGILLGRRYGALSQLVYVALGLVGLPIFTSGGGPGYVFQPSFGFLLGLIPCAWVIGYLSRKRDGALWLAASCFGGLAVLYLVGIPYMVVILNAYLGKSMDLKAILMAGMVPFLPGDALKIAVASAVCPVLQRRLCSFDEFRR